MKFRKVFNFTRVYAYHTDTKSSTAHALRNTISLYSTATSNKFYTEILNNAEVNGVTVIRTEVTSEEINFSGSPFVTNNTLHKSIIFLKIIRWPIFDMFFLSFKFFFTFQPGWKSFHLVEKVSTRVKTFSARWKGFGTLSREVVRNSMWLSLIHAFLPHAEVTCWPACCSSTNFSVSERKTRLLVSREVSPFSTRWKPWKSYQT